MTKRQSNYELMRIISMVFIVLTHFIGHGNILNNCTNEGIKIIFEILKFMIIIHVNSYVLVSGYFQSESKFKQSKAWDLVLSSWFYRIVILVIFTTLGIITVNKPTILNEIFILNINEYWYVKLFLFLYCLSPFINKFIRCLTKKDYHRLLLLLTVIFSVLPYITGSTAFENNGYSLYNFVYLYLIGAYLKKYPLEKSKMFSTITKNAWQLILIFIFLISAILNYTLYKSAVATTGINSVIDMIAGNIKIMALSYSNPLIIIQSIAYFLFFGTLFFHNKLVNNISKLTLGVYLIHDNNFIRENLYFWLKIDGRNISSYQFIGYTLGLVFIVFVACLLLEFLRQLLFKQIGKLSVSKKIRAKYYNYISNIEYKQVES